MPFDITKLESSTIIFGGLTLVALGLIWLIYRLSKYYYNHTNDVIAENTKAMLQSAVSNQRMADSHDKLADIIGKLHEKLFE